MVERLVIIAKEGRTSERLSYGLSSLALTRADVRAYSNLFGGSFQEAAEALMSLGIHGKEIEAKRNISGGYKMTRRSAAEAILGNR